MQPDNDVMDHSASKEVSKMNEVQYLVLPVNPMELAYEQELDLGNVGNCCSSSGKQKYD